MPTPMTVAQFDALTRADFDNQAVLDDIRASLRHREQLLDIGGDRWASIQAKLAVEFTQAGEYAKAERTLRLLQGKGPPPPQEE